MMYLGDPKCRQREVTTVIPQKNLLAGRIVANPNAVLRLNARCYLEFHVSRTRESHPHVRPKSVADMPVNPRFVPLLGRIACYAEPLKSWIVDFIRHEVQAQLERPESALSED